jgi:Domain of unknown function (DUF4365)
MVNPIFAPRNQRTRQHVIADLSVHHVEGFILNDGHTTQRLGSDYGYDLIVRTFDEHGFIEPGAIYFQFKAMETLSESGSDFVYDLDIRDYNLWMREETLVILILFDAIARRAFWLAVQPYFEEDISRQPKKGTKTIRVRVSKRRRVNRRAIQKMRDLK